MIGHRRCGKCGRIGHKADMVKVEREHEPDELLDVLICRCADAPEWRHPRCVAPPWAPKHKGGQGK